MTTMVELRDAEAHRSNLIEWGRLGEEIVIAEAGEPVARLVPEKAHKPRQPGSPKGKFVIHDEFYEPLPDDLLDPFEGKGDNLLGG